MGIAAYILDCSHVSTMFGVKTLYAVAIAMSQSMSLHGLLTSQLCLMQEARHNFRDAQANMLVCKQKFHAAMQAGDKQEQQHYSRQLEYWQKKALDEKHRAHKKIFSKK